MWNRVDVFTIALCLTCCWPERVFARQFSKCEFAQELRKYFAEEEIAAWTCIAQFESEFRTDAINPSNSDGSSDHGIFQINDRYWCGRNSGSNTCGVDCARLRGEDLTESIRCAQIVKDKQGFTAWAVWPRCKGQTATYLDECNGQSFLPPTIFDIQVRPANRGPGFNQTRITSALRAFQQARNQETYTPYSSLNDTRSFNLTSVGAMNFLGGGRFSFQDRLSPNSIVGTESGTTGYAPLLSKIGGMNFLGGVQLPRKSYPALGPLRNNGGMSFLGFPATRLSFNSGSQLPDAGLLSPPPKLNNFRYSGLLNTMTLIGHAYDANYPAPVKGLIYRSGQGILADQGAMNFLGGVRGLSFRRAVNSAPVRTLIVPSVKPLNLTPRQRVQQSFKARIVPSVPLGFSNEIPLRHLRAGSLLDQIAPPPQTARNVFNDPSTSSGIIPRRQTLVFGNVPRPVGPVDVSDHLVDFNQILPERKSQQAFPGSPRVQSTKLPSSRTRQFPPTARPLPDAASINSLFQRGAIQRAPIPQTSQVKGPVLSYSTGNMFFSLGTSSVDSSSRPNSQLGPAISSETFLRSPQSKAAVSNIAQTTFASNAPQTRQLTLTFPQPTFRRSPPRVAQSTLPPRSALTFPTTPLTFPGNASPSNKRRTAYGYQPQNAFEDAARFSNIRTATSKIPPRINQFEGAVRGGSFQNFQLFPPSSQTSLQTPRISTSRLTTPAARFSQPVGPIASQLFAGFPQKVQAHMPEGYGGVSYTMTNGVMTMVKHYG